LDYVTLFPLIDVKNFIQCVQSAIPGRQKMAIFTNLPSFLAKLLEIVKSLLSKKLRDRGYFYNDEKNLEKHVNKEILPSEYGGRESKKEMMEEFKKIAEKYESRLTATSNIKIDIEKNKSDDSIGSFRALEID